MTAVIQKTIRRADVLALVCLFLAPCLYYWPILFGGQVFSEGDINWLFLPIGTELARALGQWRLPLWSPGLQAGFPLLAEGQVAALYPLNIILYRLLPAYTATSYHILFNLGWASAGMYLLVRSSGLRPVSAFLAGLVFGWSGFMFAQLSHVPHETVAAWLPWLLLCQQRYWRAVSAGRNSLRWLLLAACAIGLQLLAGFPQLASFNLLVYGAAGLVAPVLWGNMETSRGWRTIRARLPAALASTLAPVVLGAALAAVQLLPTAELTGLSIRAQETGGAFFASYSLDPAYLSQFLFPFWQIGTPGAANMEYWGYVGILPFFLMLAAPFLRRDAQVRFLVGLAVIALVLALGGNTPVYGLLYYIPIINRFRVPARFLIVFTFAAAFLAAIAVDELLRRWNAPSRRSAIGYGVTLGAVALAALTVHQAYGQQLEFWMALWQWLPAVIVVASLVLLAFGLLHRMPREIWATLVVGLTVLDLAAFGAPFLSNLTRMSPPADLVQVPRTVQSMDTAQPIYRVVADKVPYTSAAIRAALWKNTSLIYDKQGVKSYLPSLGLLRNDRYVQEMSPGMRDLMNIRYYLLPLETFELGDPVPPPFDRAEPYGGLTLELLGAPPSIPPTRAVRLEVTSYTADSGNLTDGTVAGEIVLGLESGESRRLPLRLGMETADWAYDGLASGGPVKHQKPREALVFPAYLKSVGRTFDGHKYVARFDIAPGGGPVVVTSIGVEPLLPGSGLTIESIVLVDEIGRATSLATLLHRNDLALAFRSHTAAMWENQNVLPRAFLVHFAQVVTDDDALARMKQPDYAPAAVALLAEGQPLDVAGDTPGQSADEHAIISEYKPERVALRVTASRPAYLILTDSWYPGWTATVDGKEVPIQRVDYIFRALPIAPGEHSVVFQYQPMSFGIGAAVSLLALASVVVLFVVARR